MPVIARGAYTRGCEPAARRGMSAAYINVARPLLTAATPSVVIL